MLPGMVDEDDEETDVETLRPSVTRGERLSPAGRARSTPNTPGRSKSASSGCVLPSLRPPCAST